MRGVSSYSGAAVQNDLDSNYASQETLVTIPEDTGGRAFLDSNDFSRAYAKVQADSETYYVSATAVRIQIEMDVSAASR